NRASDIPTGSAHRQPVEPIRVGNQYYDSVDEIPGSAGKLLPQQTIQKMIYGLITKSYPQLEPRLKDGVLSGHKIELTETGVPGIVSFKVTDLTKPEQNWVRSKGTLNVRAHIEYP